MDTLVGRSSSRPPETGQEESADGVLVEQAVAGDERAFEVLVSRYQRSLLNSIQTILKDNEQANDVLQEVLLQLYLSLPTLRRDVPLKPWLFQVARRRCLDEVRRGRARPALRFSELSRDNVQALTETIQDPHPLPEEILEQVDLHAALQKAIGKLPNGWGSIVDLRFFGDLRFTEIAQALNMPISTVKTYCYHSLQRLRPILEDRLPRVRVKEVHPLVLIGSDVEMHVHACGLHPLCFPTQSYSISGTAVYKAT